MVARFTYSHAATQNKERHPRPTLAAEPEATGKLPCPCEQTNASDPFTCLSLSLAVITGYTAATPVKRREDPCAWARADREKRLQQKTIVVCKSAQVKVSRSLAILIFPLVTQLHDPCR